MVEDTALTTNNISSCPQMTLSLQISKKHRALNSNSPLYSQNTKQAWEKDLGLAIDDADWQEICSQVINMFV